MDYYGCTVNTDEGNVEIKSRPRPRQRLLLIATIILCPLAVAGGIAAGQIAMALGAAVVGIGLGIFFYRELMIASREKLEFGSDEVMRWNKVRGFKIETFEKPLYDITPDAQGARIMLKTYIHNAPGSRKPEGFPAVLWIYASRGEGAGYDMLFKARILEKDVEEIAGTLLEHLPQSRRKG